LKVIVIGKINNIFPESELYDIHSNEFALIYMLDDKEKLQRKTDLFFEENFLLTSIEHYVFTFILKVGIYTVDKNETDSRSIYTKARISIDQSDDNNSGIYYYDQSLYNNQKLYFEVASSLRDSLRNDEFYLVYQPVVSFKDNIVIGCEVLTRWNRGDKTPVGPAMFIEVAEKIGCISDFSIWIISETIKQTLKWRKKDINIRIGVNVTAKEIVDKKFVKVIKNKIEADKIDRSLISIEITERVLANEIEGLKEALEELRNKGFKISIDDFGTGYNSLKFIGDIPFDILKIDKYFIDHINKFETIALVSSIIEAAHNMGKKVVAEGIEEEYQVSILKELGCDFAQGYYFSKPLLPNDFEQFYYKYNNIA
jgi:EAL domain-containing protein (putative c-di-GMP-specific phosphodiesterase class I)